MKKSIFIAVLGAATAVAAYGQGQINFSNYYASTQTTGVSYGNGPDAGKFVGPEMTAILLWGASGTASVAGLTALSGSATPFGLGVATGPGALGTGAGWFSGGGMTINGGTPGTFAFAIEVTGTLGGVTYIGYSPVVNVATSASNLVPPSNFPDSVYKGSFTVVQAIPEPMTMALGGLGLAALIAFRRKQV